MQTEPRVDDYLQKAAPFARPILEHLRRLVHETCPEVKEVIKWSSPHFEYKGNLCHIAAFKQHCAFGFWKAPLMESLKSITVHPDDEAMGSFGRITALADLPADKVIISCIKEAMRLNEDGTSLPASAGTKSGVPKPAIAEPDDFVAALKRNVAAQKTWEAFAPSHRREYLEWITEAKTTATREKRLLKTLDQLSEGKSKHWKYQ